MRHPPDLRELLGDLHAQTWRSDAACRGVDPEIFHPERGESTAYPRSICASCPVQADCREYAVIANEKYGIWGDTSRRERRRLRNARAA